MSQTRNQRRRDILAQIFRLGMLVAVIVMLGMLLRQCAQIEAMQKEINDRRPASSVRSEEFLPKGFDPSCPEYQAALQRYDEEHGLILPGEKETAPELADSETVDTENSAS